MSKLTLWNKCQKAASILDKEKPWWYKKIDIDALYIESCSYCVLGQLFGDYTSSLSNNILHKAEKMKIREAFGGFLCHNEERRYDDLKKYWTTLIKIRIKK